MKKSTLSLCAAGLLTLGLASCGGHGDATVVDNDTIIPKALADSISICQGKYIGGYVLNDYMNFTANNSESFTKEDIVKGVQLVFSGDKSQATIMGMQLGMQMLSEVKQLEAQGVDIDREKLISNFKQAFMQDTVNQMANTLAYNDYQILTGRAEEIITARDNARRASAPEAIQNAQVGRAFIDKAKADDPDVKTAASGLVYKIIAQGDTTKITPSTNVELKYTEKKVDGTTTFTTGDAPRTIAPSRLNQGLEEGVTMLGVGGKAILYVPAELAYGLDGMPQRGIGPNEVIVYQIEVAGVE